MKNTMRLLIVVSGILMVTQSSARLIEEEKPYADAPESGDVAAYLVSTELPGADPRSYYLRTLSTVLGSEEAAEHALMYTYTTACTGFAARLTRQQAYEISRQPKVLHVIRSKKLKLNRWIGN